MAVTACQVCTLPRLPTTLARWARQRGLWVWVASGALSGEELASLTRAHMCRIMRRISTTQVITRRILILITGGA